MRWFYPDDEQTLFTNRAYELGVLDLAATALRRGERHHLALIGFRRVGKTLILKEFIRRLLSRRAGDVLPVYLDLQRVALTPRQLALDYVGTVVGWASHQGPPPPAQATDPVAITASAGTLGAEATAIVEAFMRDHARVDLPDRAILERALALPEDLAESIGRPLMVCLDEFQLWQTLDNFPELGSGFDMFRAALQVQSKVAYVAAGSAVRAMDQIFGAPAAPLFLHFRRLAVGPFTREDTHELARKKLAILEQMIPGETVEAIYRLSRGHPYYTWALADRFVELVALHGRDVTPGTVEEAFVLETLKTDGRIYGLARHLLDESLARARGQASLRAVLNVVAAAEQPLSLAEVARGLRRTAGATRVLLQRLVDVDLIARVERGYALADPVLQIWLAYFVRGVELLEIPRAGALQRLIAEVLEKYQRVSTELGVARESQVRELLRHFSGQEVDGRLFGLSGKVRVPTFKAVTRYEAEDGSGEVDAVASNGETWVVAVRWRNRQATIADLNRFLKVARSHGDRYWFIAKSGFKANALRFAREAGIMVSNDEAIQGLSERLGVRFSR